MSRQINRYSGSGGGGINGVAGPSSSMRRRKSSLSSISSNNNNNGSGNNLDRDEFEVESIKVVVRCRGRGNREISINSPNIVTIPEDMGKQIKINLSPDENINNFTINNNHNNNNSCTNLTSARTYTLDKVYGPGSDQMSFFQGGAERMCDEFLKGYNCTIFAYGQTGAGKTYTMCGDIQENYLNTESGIVPRCLNRLFETVDNNNFIIKCSFVEIYNEELNDLLNDSKFNNNKLRIFEQKKSIKINGLEEFHIKTFKEALKLLKQGMEKRQTAATKMNDLSSRSHTIFTITLLKRKISNNNSSSTSNEYQFAKMNLVDLAGSENITRSGSINQRAKEAGSINQSLLTLGRVINCLVDGSNFIPYRDSKLTRLLQDSLGGKTKTMLVANISPTLIDLQATLSTLEYAAKAKNIKNTAQIGPVIPEEYLIKELVEENHKLKLDLIATRRKESCIILDENNYNLIILENNNFKVEIDELKRFKESISNQLELKIKEVELEKNEKKNLISSINSVEKKLIDFENKFNNQKAFELKLKNQSIKLTKLINVDLNELFNKQINESNFLSMKMKENLKNLSFELKEILNSSSSNKKENLVNLEKKINKIMNNSVIDLKKLSSSQLIFLDLIKNNFKSILKSESNLKDLNNSINNSNKSIKSINEEFKSKNLNLHEFLNKTLFNKEMDDHENRNENDNGNGSELSIFISKLQKESISKFKSFQKETMENYLKMYEKNLNENLSETLNHLNGKLNKKENEWFNNVNKLNKKLNDVSIELDSKNSNFKNLIEINKDFKNNNLNAEKNLNNEINKIDEINKNILNDGIRNLNNFKESTESILNFQNNGINKSINKLSNIRNDVEVEINEKNFEIDNKRKIIMENVDEILNLVGESNDNSRSPLKSISPSKREREGSPIKKDFKKVKN